MSNVSFSWKYVTLFVKSDMQMPF